MKKTKKLVCTILTGALALGLLAGCAQKQSGTVSTDGSTSMEKVIGVLGEAFQNENKNITFTYNPTGSGSGIQAVSEGRCDIGLSSRALKQEELDSGLTETVLAYDGIAVVVHPDNPVFDLDVDTIAKVTPGRSPTGRTWAAATPRSSSSAGRRAAAPGTASSPSRTPRISAPTARS